MWHKVLVVAVFTASVCGFVVRPAILEGDDVLVRTENGVLRGVVASSFSGTLYNRFVGVRYAAPPLGDLRFRPPQPLDSWTGVRDALTFGPMCSQLGAGSEDCLYLNVYVPADSGTSFAVAVNIHGGGFTSGNSAERVPDHFMDKGVILVTINYRLGPIGFLSLQNDVIAGNAGLKDQVMALQWVQQNIAAFGGDPARVSIFGESAGGCSTSHLFLSPATKGLFSAVIAESGISTATWGVDLDPRSRAYCTAWALGFQSNSTDDDVRLAAFLRSLNHTELSLGPLLTPNSTVIECQKTMMGFFPVLEPESDNAVITQMPSDVIRSGNYNQVPVIAGVTSADGVAIYLSSGVWIGSIADAIAKNFSAFLMPYLSHPTDEERLQAGQRIEQFYFGDEGFNMDNQQAVYDVFSDLFFIYPAEFFVRAVANTSTAPVYLYYFDYDGLGSIPYGMVHGGETLYLFYNGTMDVNSDDGQVGELITTLWTNVPKYSEPAPFGNPVIWKSFTPNAANYLEMNEHSVTRQDLLKERMSFWREVMPL